MNIFRALVLGSLVLLRPVSAAVSTPKPNLVFLFADDWAGATSRLAGTRG